MKKFANKKALTMTLGPHRVLLIALAAVPAVALRAPVVGRSAVGMSSVGPESLRGIARALPDFSPRAPAAGAAATTSVGSALVAASLVAVAALPEPVHAAGGAYGLLEKKLPALVHPAIMAGMFLVSVTSAYTGYQWRQLREVSKELGSLKATLKPLEEGEAPSATRIETEAKIAELAATRTSLASANLRDTHWATGSVLLGVGTSFAIEGPVNTYMRAGKLFPGPHLYAGAGCIVLWALAASLTPQMQKGNDLARTGHIAFNVAGIGLFSWQLTTGFDILTKVWAKVPW